MKLSIRNPKDFWSGVIFIFFGLSAVYIGQDYAMGSAGRMGPGYFPTVLGWILAAIGTVGAARALIQPGEGMGRFAVKELCLVLLATVLFGVLVRTAGLVVATIVLVMLGGYASTRFKWLPYLAVAIGVAFFSALVFVVGLGLPMPMFGAWLGF